MFESSATFAPRGVGGVLKSTSSLFFGFVGFDEVCCMASKAENPSTTMPRALAGTLLGAAVFSGLAQFALAGMVPYREGMDSVPFEMAFEQHGISWARWLVSVGELTLLPLVVLLCILPQPEVTAAMAEDRLLPSVFKRMNQKGVYVQGGWICGVALTLMAVAVPFVMLWDIISLGVLVSFNLTNASLINVRYGNGGIVRQPQVDALVWSLMLFMMIAGFTTEQGIVMPFLQGRQPEAISILLMILSFAAALAVMLVIRLRFKQVCDMNDPNIFKAWGVPFVPGVAMFFNSFLLATLPWFDWGYFAVVVAVFVGMYVSYVQVKARGSAMNAHARDRGVEVQLEGGSAIADESGADVADASGDCAE